MLYIIYTELTKLLSTLSYDNYNVTPFNFTGVKGAKVPFREGGDG